MFEIVKNREDLNKVGDAICCLLTDANMERKREITQYRERLDKTLSSAELTDSETLKTLVKNQILKYAEDEKQGYRISPFFTVYPFK